MQNDFLVDILEKCKKVDIHTTLDTTGFSSEKQFRKVLNYVDLFLFDLKLVDNDMHKQYTGVGNNEIFSHLSLLNSLNKPCYIRIPLVQGITDTVENIDGIIECIRHSNNIKIVNLLPYHRLGEGKRSDVGLHNEIVLNPPTDVRLNEIIKQFEENKFTVKTGG